MVFGIETRWSPWNASPVFLTKVHPLKTGEGRLVIEGIMALGEKGPHRFNAEITVQHRGDDIIVGQWLENTWQATATIVPISPDWLDQHCPALSLAIKRCAPGSVGSDQREDAGLEVYFGANEFQIIAKPETSSRVHPNLDQRPTSRKFVCEASYGSIDSQLIQRGYSASEMEQKWNIDVFLNEEGGSVVFRRSWTGFTVYEWPFVHLNGGIEFKHAWLNAEPDQYQFGTPWEESERLLEVAEGLLLGRQHSGRWSVSNHKNSTKKQIEMAWRREQNYFF